MKLIGVREAKDSLAEIIERAQREDVLITKHGKPAALLVGVEGEDLERLVLKSDKAFWAELERQRRGPDRSVPLEEVEERISRRAGVRRGRSRSTGRR